MRTGTQVDEDSFAGTVTTLTVIASGDYALGRRVDTTEAAVGETRSMVQATSQALVDVNGKISASYSLKLQIAANGQYYAAGMGIGIENQPDGSYQSQVLFTADRFAFVNLVNGQLTSPFVIQGGQTFINQALIGTAWITSAKIADAAITNAKISGAIQSDGLRRWPNRLADQQGGRWWIRVQRFRRRRLSAEHHQPRHLHPLPERQSRCGAWSVAVMVDIGLRVRSESGYVETTVTTKLSKMIGSYTFPLYNPVNSNNKWVAPPEANGGLIVNDFSGGEPFYYFTCEGQRSAYGMLVPSVTISGNSINWSWDPDVVNYHVRMEMFPSRPTTDTVGGLTLHYGIYS